MGDCSRYKGGAIRRKNGGAVKRRALGGPVQRPMNIVAGSGAPPVSPLMPVAKPMVGPQVPPVSPLMPGPAPMQPQVLPAMPVGRKKGGRVKGC